MNGCFMALTLTTLAVLAIGAVCGNLWAQRIREFLPAARNRERLVALAKGIASGTVDGMLIAIPGRSSASSRTLPTCQHKYDSGALLGPFGDWQAETLRPPKWSRARSQRCQVDGPRGHAFARFQ